MVLKLFMFWRKICLWKVESTEDTVVEKHGRKTCYKKTRFYCSICSDENKKFYYCQGFSRISIATSTCFLKRQHSMSLGYGWLMCLSPFHTLLYLLNLFCLCFLPVPLITPCIVFVDCFNACDDRPVIRLSYNVNLHSYDSQLKKGSDLPVSLFGPE